MTCSAASFLLPPLAAWLPYAVPGVFVLGAVDVAIDRVSPDYAWSRARGTALAAGLLATMAACFGTGLTFPQSVLLVFVGLLAVVLTRFASSYLAGEPGERRFAGWLLTTLGGATFVLVTDDLLQLCLGWLATSLAMTRLLTFYPEREGALAAARDKFWVSRTGDLLMAIAVVRCHQSLGTLRIDTIAERAARGDLPGEARTAMFCVAAAALLKCAQLPFHRWLLGIMEAPTPVSALLHAGVVNLGGFVLIRLGPVLAQAPAAQWLLVLVGGLTAAAAALAAHAQSSVKRRLAWSTCAQMGFLMVQCGLGAHELALLHLVAHSAYKAHAFLGAGSIVGRVAGLAGAPRPRPVLTPRLLVTALLGASALVATLLTLLQPSGWRDPAVVVGACVAVGAVTGLLAGTGAPASAAASRAWLAATLMVGVWVVLHDRLRLAMQLPPTASATWPLACAALLALAPLPLLRVLQSWRPHHPWVERVRAFSQRDPWAHPWPRPRGWPAPTRLHAPRRLPDLTMTTPLAGDRR